MPGWEVGKAGSPVGWVGGLEGVDLRVEWVADTEAVVAGTDPAWAAEWEVEADPLAWEATVEACKEGPVCYRFAPVAVACTRLRFQETGWYLPSR